VPTDTAEEMKLAAAYVITSLIPDSKRTPEFIIS
jgi:hypothetical protein